MASSAPLTPFWTQPSHPEIQKVLLTSKDEFTTKSISTVDLAPYALFAKMAFPPCTSADRATYATVQMGRQSHLNLNSDLVYINHSCEPSVIFDMSSLSIIAGPNGLRKDQELTFFYPSTEWDMAQGFDCFCSTSSCKGYIAGAKSMPPAALSGMWLNTHIRELLELRDNKTASTVTNGTPNLKPEIGVGADDAEKADATEAALNVAVDQARKMVDAAQRALDTYKSLHASVPSSNPSSSANGASNGHGPLPVAYKVGAGKGGGVSARELAGEMGGDTTPAA